MMVVGENFSLASSSSTCRCSAAVAEFGLLSKLCEVNGDSNVVMDSYANDVDTDSNVDWKSNTILGIFSLADFLCM